MTVTLTEFLLARIAEDEAAARNATDGPWRYNPAKVNAVDRGEAVFAGEAGTSAITVASTGTADDRQSMSDAAHIARHDPTRVLAECEAKRRIVESFQDAEQAVATYDHDNPVPAYWQEWGNRHALASVIEDLATVYADHPDFDPAWAV